MDFRVFSRNISENMHARCVREDTKQTLIFHKNAREYSKYSLRFLFHVTKNLTTHLPHNLCAVLPEIIFGSTGMHRLPQEEWLW